MVAAGYPAFYVGSFVVKIPNLKSQNVNKDLCRNSTVMMEVGTDVTILYNPSIMTDIARATY